MSRLLSDLSLRWCALTVLLLASPPMLRAQFSVVNGTARSGCLSSIPADSMVPVLVYVTADPAAPVGRARRSRPRADSSMLPNVAVIAQAVAEQIRSMLGERGDTLPSGAPKISWRSLDAPVIVGAWRDGRLSSRVERDTADTSGSSLLTRAFAAARAAGVGVVWSDSTVDSLVFDLSLTAPVVTHSHSVLAQHDPIQVPAFTLAIPWIESEQLQHPVSPEYPRDALMESAQATIYFRYVVDMLGRVDPRSVREGRDMAWLPPTLYLHDFYTKFVQAARVALLQWKFRPARVGGCPVAVSVAQSFMFRVRGLGNVRLRFETP